MFLLLRPLLCTCLSTHQIDGIDYEQSIVSALSANCLKRTFELLRRLRISITVTKLCQFPTRRGYKEEGWKGISWKGISWVHIGRG